MAQTRKRKQSQKALDAAEAANNQSASKSNDGACCVIIRACARVRSVVPRCPCHRDRNDPARIVVRLLVRACLNLTDVVLLMSNPS